jgi:phage terminase small subunit
MRGMAGIGPPPIPAKVAKLRGTYRRDRHEARETPVDPPGDLGKSPPPKHLTSREAAIWRITVRNAPWLRPVDGDLLASYCQCVGDIEQLSAARVACDTMLPETEKSMRAATRQLTMLANALALTPSQRQRLFVNKAEEAPPAVDDVWAQLRRFPRIGPA